VGTRGDGLDAVRGPDDDGGSNVVDVMVPSLRRNLGGRMSMSETVRGAGCRRCRA
jgi:DNA-binding response OmpR family regulator